MGYVKVDGIQVDPRIFLAKFCCDYEKCKGACCNQPLPGVELMGGGLTNYEAAELLYHRRALSLLCDEDARQVALEQPVSKDNGLFYTTLKKSKCVFCSMQQGTCVLKIAKAKGITPIGIPLSCQLYPIVLDACSKRLLIGDIFDKDYCIHGYIKGEREGIYLLDFLKDPIVGKFGEAFFLKLKEMQKKYL